MSLLKLRDRFRSIKSLHSILSAMEVVTTVRIQRTKETLAEAEKYLGVVTQTLKGRVGPEVCSGKKLVVFTASRGLCGSFNANILSKVEKEKQALPGVLVLKPAAVDFEVRGRINFPKVIQYVRALQKESSEIYVAYNSYRGGINTKAVVTRIYPSSEELVLNGELPEVILEPTPKKLVASLYVHYVEARFFCLLLNSQLAELAARLMVLSGAVDNSKELITELQVTINKTRQAAITRELTELITSSEALRRDVDEQ